MSETYAQARHRIAMTPIPLEAVRRRLLNRGSRSMTWAEYAERGRSSIRGKQNNAISNRADWVRQKRVLPAVARRRCPIATKAGLGGCAHTMHGTGVFRVHRLIST